MLCISLFQIHKLSYLMFYRSSKMESKIETSFSRFSMPKVRQEIRCNICDKHLSSKPALKGHMLRIHEEKTKYFCEICNTTFGIIS